jgi:Rrf2 family protein
MASNSRFYIATHVCVLLATFPDARFTSESIADSVGTSPVVIRRTMARMRAAGLIASRPGAGGGFALSRPAWRISLADVYQAMEEHAVLEPHGQTPNQRCIVGGNIHAVMRDVSNQVEDMVAATLRGVTVADLVDRIRDRTRYSGKTVHASRT